MDVWISPRVALRLLSEPRIGGRGSTLTASETEMLWRIANGQLNDQIAAEMSISPGTLRNHLSHIYAKLSVRSRAEAVSWAWRNGVAQSGV